MRPKKANKKQDYTYGIMINTEMEMGLPQIIPFRISPASPPTKHKRRKRVDWEKFKNG